MDLFSQINPEEMLSALMVTTFLILLATSIVVVSSMVMFPLIDLAFKTKATSTPRLAQVETAQLSGRPWLALRADFLRPDARLVDVNYWLKMRNVEGYRNYDSPRERITPLIVRLLVPKGSEGAPTGPVTAPPAPLTSNRKAA